MSEKNRVTKIIPEGLASASSSFVDFIKAYYDYMNQEGMPSHMLTNSVLSRDVYRATDTYLDVLYKEFGASWVENREGDRANIIARMNEIYKTKGSLDSIKVLFRAIYGEEVLIKLPKEFILKPSTGNWLQDYSIIGRLEQGDITTAINKFVTVTTQFPGSPEQRFDVEIKRVEVRDQLNGIYEIFISRYYTGFFFTGSTISYQGVEITVLDSTSTVVGIPEAGTQFRTGDVYQIPHREVNSTYTYIDGLTGATRTTYMDAIGNLFEPKTFQRWYRSNDGVNINKQENVTRQNYANGTQVETVERDEVTKTIITRGLTRSIQSRFIDGTVKVETEANPDGQIPLNITIDWDYVLTEFIKEFTATSALSAFFNEIPSGESFARGDINNDGTIDINDIQILARKALGFNVSGTDLTWIQTHIETELLNQGLAQNFTLDEGAGLSVRVIESDTNAGITQLRVVSFGYNFPAVYTTFIQPYEQAGNPATVIFTSRPVSVTAAEYSDRRGFLSDIIKIQDNDYYQEFSYAVETSLNPTTAADAINQSLHPAGMKLFSDQVITEIFDADLLDLNTDHTAGPLDVANLFTELAYEVTRISDTIAVSYNKPLADGLQIDDSQFKAYSLGQLTENFTVDDSAFVVQQQLYVESGYFYDDFDYVTFFLQSIQIA